MLGNFAARAITPDSPADMVSVKTRLHEIIVEKSLRFGDFRLASGRKSTILFDMKPTMLDPEGANLLADAILDVLEEEGIDCLGGLVMGAVPLVVAVCVKSYRRRPVDVFFVRKEPKEHGTKNVIDGNLRIGSEVAVVDDVTTTGGSVLQAVNEVRAAGCTVKKVITVVDRLEGARENLESHGLDLIPLFTKDDFLSCSRDADRISSGR